MSIINVIHQKRNRLDPEVEKGVKATKMIIQDRKFLIKQMIMIIIDLEAEPGVEPEAG